MAKQSTKYPVKDIPIKDIDRSRNHRLPDLSDKTKLESLTASIKVGGQMVVVRIYERGPDQRDSKHKEPYILGFGDRRCRALLSLDNATVRAEVYPPATDLEIEQARAIENLERKDLSVLEEVQMVDNMLGALKRDKTFKGDPYEEVATRLARPITWVKDHDYLHRLTKPVRAFVARIDLPAGHLRELAKVGDPETQLVLACDCVGAPHWAFHAMSSGNGEHAAKVRMEFIESVADGLRQRWPLSKLKQRVDDFKRSLKVVPWEYDKPVTQGKVKLRACKDCPHNSETDRTLFGLESESNNPRGYCLNASCYEAKRKAADAAKQGVLKKIAKRKEQTPAAIRRASPTWLKESSVVGFVQRELKKAEGNDTPVEPKPVRRTQQKPGRALTSLEKAIVAFSKDQDTWEIESYTAIMETINANSVHRVGWCLLVCTEAFWDHGGWDFPTVSEHSDKPCTEVPTLSKLPPKVKQAIELAMKGTKAAWVELASWTFQDDPDDRAQIGWLHPDALVVFADAIGVKLTARPVWKAPAPSTINTPVKA